MRNKAIALVWQALAIVGFVFVFGLAASYGLDKTIENQDRMLCNSAKVSGNREHFRKCQCYYESNSILCLQGEGGEK